MDPISDMFIRIKNAYRAGHETVHIPFSKFKYELLKAIERSGFVNKVERKGKRVRKVLEAELKYKDEQPALGDVKLISKTSRRVYTHYKDIKLPKGGGVFLISTTKGVLTGAEARKAKVGGEIIAEIY